MSFIIMSKNDDRPAFEPLESGHRLFLYRLINIVSFSLLAILVWALVVRPWNIAESEARKLTSKIALCHKGVTDLGIAVGKSSDDPSALLDDVESVVSDRDICRANLTGAQQSSERSSDTISSAEGIFGSIDQRSVPKDAPLCRSRLSVLNNCSDSIAYEVRTTSGNWRQYNVPAEATSTVEAVQWCDRNEVFLRPAASAKKGSAVTRLALFPSVPVSDSTEASVSTVDVELYCTGNSVALFER